MIQEYQINATGVIRALLLVFFLLLIAHAAMLFSTHFLGHGRLYGIVKLFNFNAEQNIPTLFSVMLLLFNSLLFHLNYRNNILAGNNGGWRILSVAFIFLAIDEFSSIHEMLTDPSRALFHASGFLYFAWVIPYAILLGLLAITMAPLMFKLPRPFLFRYVLAGGLYVGGAVGFELLGGRYVESNGHDFAYSLLTTAEESLEMLGLILCIHTSITLLQTKWERLTFSITNLRND